jgi:hypothetical protein
MAADFAISQFRFPTGSSSSTAAGATSKFCSQSTVTRLLTCVFAGGYGGRLRHLPVPLPGAAAPGPRRLVLQAHRAHGVLLLLQEHRLRPNSLLVQRVRLLQRADHLPRLVFDHLQRGVYVTPSGHHGGSGPGRAREHAAALPRALPAGARLACFSMERDGQQSLEICQPRLPSCI